MKVYVLLAPGFETVEALTPVDVLHRAKIDVETVSIAQGREVESSHGVKVTADRVLSGADDLADADLVVLPGGYPGYVNLATDQRVLAIARRQYSSRRLLGAICGAPTVLAAAGIAPGASVACHSSVAAKMTEAGYKVTGDRVVVDHNIITAAGAGISLHFALALVAALTDGDKQLVQHLCDAMELK